jgi:hypothetical protein
MWMAMPDDAVKVDEAENPHAKAMWKQTIVAIRQIQRGTP